MVSTLSLRAGPQRNNWLCFEALQTSETRLGSRRFCFCGFCLACQGDTAEPKAVGGDATLASNEASLLRGIAGVLFIVNGFGCC